MENPTDNNSLIEQGETQLELLSSDEMDGEIFRESEDRHEFTGKRLFKNDPERYRNIISLVAEGLPIIRISKLLNVSAHTVRGIREREEGIVAQVKERLIAYCRDGAQMCAEAILEDLDDEVRRKKISTRDKSIIFGVLTDKYQLLSGGATARVELTLPQPEHEDFNSYLAGLERVEPETGMSMKKRETKEPIALLPAVAESHLETRE